MASSTFSGPVTSTAGFIGSVVLPTYTVATAPDASSVTAGTIIYVSNGEAGSPCVAVSDGSDWYAGTGAVIAAV